MELVSPLGTVWRGVSDQSHGWRLGRARRTRRCRRAGPFSACAATSASRTTAGSSRPPLTWKHASGGLLDASAYRGLRLTVRGNDQQYSLHLRTPDATRPWQSYRAHFTAAARWQTFDLPFAAFAPYRLDSAPRYATPQTHRAGGNRAGVLSRPDGRKHTPLRVVRMKLPQPPRSLGL